MAQPDAPGFIANFFHDYQVTISHPISEVFRIIGTPDGAQQVTRLNKLATTFELGEKDNVAIPASASLAESTVRELPASTAGTKVVATTRQLPRQFFNFTEAVPILGLARYVVHLSGTLTYDEPARLSLYETRSQTGILVWKLRTFEEIDGTTTRVSESVKGRCPTFLKPIVQSTTLKGHKAHMDSYHTLFK